MNQTAKKVRTPIASKLVGKTGAQVISFRHNAVSRQRLHETEKLYNQHVGKRIRMARQMFGKKSQEWLAEQLGFTFQQIQKMEKGVNRTSAGRLLQIAKVLQVPITFFYDGLDGGKSKTPTLSTFETKVCHALKGITGNGAAQNRFLKFVRIMGKK